MVDTKNSSNGRTKINGNAEKNIANDIDISQLNQEKLLQKTLNQPESKISHNFNLEKEQLKLEYRKAILNSTVLTEVVKQLLPKLLLITAATASLVLPPNWFVKSTTADPVLVAVSKFIAASTKLKSAKAQAIGATALKTPDQEQGKASRREQGQTPRQEQGNASGQEQGQLRVPRQSFSVPSVDLTPLPISSPPGNPAVQNNNESSNPGNTTARPPLPGNAPMPSTNTAVQPKQEQPNPTPKNPEPTTPAEIILGEIKENVQLLSNQVSNMSNQVSESKIHLCQMMYGPVKRFFAPYYLKYQQCIK